MSGTCSRCGRAGEVEYGSDGMSYCTSCIFYGLNKQCVRCRMYLPGSELQQYRGQLTCPYCIQDLRDEDRRANEYHQERPRMEPLQIPEVCQRCGRDLKGTVYIWNDKKLCRQCMEEEQEKWGLVSGGPGGAPQRISLERVKKGRKTSLIEKIISEFLHITGIRKKKIEIIEYQTKMPIQHAKPMAENPMRKKEEVKPDSEGLMGVRKDDEFFERPAKPVQNAEEGPTPQEILIESRKRKKRRKKEDAEGEKKRK